MDESSFKPLLLKLVSDPDSFEAEDVEAAIDHLAIRDAVNPTQIGAFLTALKLSKLDRTPQVLSACARAMMRHSIPVSVESPGDFYVDIVGTGGDGHNTFNVSTSAAIVAAGAGARVIKVITRISQTMSARLSPIITLSQSMAIKLLLHPQVPLIFFVRWDALFQLQLQAITLSLIFPSHSFWRLIITLLWLALHHTVGRSRSELSSMSSGRS